MTIDVPLRSLTKHEKLALQANVNLSDGHAHQSPNEREARIIARASDYFLAHGVLTQRDLENHFLQCYFSLALGTLGGATRPWAERTEICYSASNAMEVVANVLRLKGVTRALVLQPTFDNIPSILTRHGLQIVPIEDETLAATPSIAAKVGAGAIVVVAPNNPTGQGFTRAWFAEMAEVCERHGIVLVVDYAFRFFDGTMRWDQYSLLENSGASFLAIEDLGKIWPTQDLKVGLLTGSKDMHATVDLVHDDFLLNVSPFTLKLLTEFSTAARPEVILSDLRGIPRLNRAALHPLVERGFIDETLLDTLSVAWLKLPSSDGDADAICAAARRQGVHILPGGLFYFAQKTLGRNHIRIALMRDRPTVVEGVRRLLECSDVSTAILEGPQW